MDRLSIVLTLITGPILVGGLVTVAFTLGFYNWVVIGGSVIIGYLAAWPSAYWISRRIKRQDPDWDERAKDRKLASTSTLPRPGEPEV